MGAKQGQNGILRDERIYLDHAATMPVCAEAASACAEGLVLWANPSSPHMHGRNARMLLEDARARIAAALEWDGEIILTSGASEAIAIALLRGRATQIIHSPVEHQVLLRLAEEPGHGRLSYALEVDALGHVLPESLDKALGQVEGRDLVAIQSANNETGVIQPLEELGAIARQHGAIFFVDCAQSAGKMPLPDADLIAVSAHKLGGPPGIGALLVRNLDDLKPSGGQEKGYRSGTENLPAALGFAAALERNGNWVARARDLRQQLDALIVKAGGTVIAQQAIRLPTISGYAMPGMSANAQLIQFDLAGISVSAGSACSSGTLKTSHVLSAMGVAEDIAANVIRVSIGAETSRSEIYRFVEIWQSIAQKQGQDGASPPEAPAEQDAPDTGSGDPG